MRGAPDDLVLLGGDVEADISAIRDVDAACSMLDYQCQQTCDGFSRRHLLRRHGTGTHGEACTAGCDVGHQCDSSGASPVCRRLCDVGAEASMCADGESCVDLPFNDVEDLGWCT